MFFNDTFRLSIAAILLSLACTTALESGAQNASPSPVKIDKSRLFKKTGENNNVEKLNDRIPLNGVPEYSGKQKFHTGHRFMSEVGPQISEEFYVMEQVPQIVEWYKGALPSYKWEIVASDGNSVSAKLSNGSSIMVVAAPIKSSEGRSVVKINFHERTKTN